MFLTFRYLYWADRRDFNRIERSNTNGQSREILLNTSSAVTSLALDMSPNTLYVASESGNVIQALSLEGGSEKSRQILWNITVQKPYGLAVSGQYIYWSNTSAVYRVDKISGNNVELVRGNFVKASGITVFHSEGKASSISQVLARIFHGRGGGGVGEGSYNVPQRPGPKKINVRMMVDATAKGRGEGMLPWKNLDISDS